MPGVIATIPKFLFSANGIPMVGGTLTAYIAGSTTPTNTWQDAAMTVANTNPVTLDARGECVLWLDPAIVYKFILKNAQGVVQWTQDNISNPAALRLDLAAATGATLVGFQQLGTGATLRNARDKLRESVSVMDFGAAGDGVNDDRPAFQRAVDYLATRGISGTLLIPTPSVAYAFKSAHASGHGLVLPQPCIALVAGNYTQIRADVAMSSLIYASGANVNFIGLENLILQCNSLAQKGFSSAVMGASLHMSKVLCYDSLSTGLEINYYESVLDHCKALRSGGHNIHVRDGVTSVVMIQPGTGSIAHALASIKIGVATYTTLISPYVDAAPLGIEIGDIAGLYAESVTLIEPGFENVGKCLKISKAGVNIVGGTILKPTVADYRFEFANADVSVNSAWHDAPGTITGTANLYKLTSGVTTFMRRIKPALVSHFSGAMVANAIVTTLAPRNIYINEAGGVDTMDGATVGAAVKTWARVNELIGSFVDAFVNVILTNTTSAQVTLDGFSVRGSGGVLVSPLTSCTVTAALIQNVWGGAANYSVDFAGFTLAGTVTVNSASGVKVRACPMNAAITGVSATMAQVEVTGCTANGVNNFILASKGSNVHSSGNTGSATNTAAYVERGGRVTREGTQPTGPTQAVTGGQLI